MASKISKGIQAAVNALLTPAGIELVRRRTASGTNPHILGYLSARETVMEAETRGLSVCNYLEQLWNEPGNTQAVVDHMGEFGVFDEKISTVCEIGAGSGRFLEKTMARCRPSRYESYEPDREWADWLQKQYGVISQPTDGYSLRHTPSASIDLAHAHGVFVYLPFLTTYRYFREIARVVSDRGHVVFDIMSEDCLDEASVNEWLRSEHNYPCMLARQYVLQLFESWDFLLRGEFSSRLFPVRSQYMVFERVSAR